MDYYFTYRFNRRNLAKLKSGLLLGSIVDRMLEKVFNTSAVGDAVKKQGETPSPNTPTQTGQPDKAYFYISHDTTMAGLMSSLKVFNNRNPPFASTLYIELHRYENTSDNNYTIDHATLKNIVDNISKNKYDITDDVNNYYITLLYRNETEDIEKQPYKLVVPGCEERCALAKFLYLTHDNVVTNWRETCFPSSNESQTNNSYTWTITLRKNGAIMTIVISCIIFVILVILIVACLVMKCRSYKTYRKYVDLPTEIN
ncbi:hypothetical protein HELRODRAFT_191469 [Helobdella robusta]|uniref:acid phosphatase n=1 Tax=Helobdella robusta TaxID=6412 RepID=T1FT06_HELRO|nr:hypothetical protein HELRODRAFT_191469 [Helobdella robusta]ESO05406.1 hypothetical protein HELRODRAFT_191469 [Helobdella robusta]